MSSPRVDSGGILPDGDACAGLSWRHNLANLDFSAFDLMFPISDLMTTDVAQARAQVNHEQVGRRQQANCPTTCATTTTTPSTATIACANTTYSPLISPTTLHRDFNQHKHTSHTYIMTTPSEPPPSYEAAINNGHGSNQASSSSRPQGQSGHLQVPGQGDDDAIPAAIRRSMEDEARSLPKGWVRSYDPETTHQFFVDTTSEPPRSIWTHPYDDEDYLRTLSSEARERIEAESLRHPHDAQPSKEDIMHDHTDISEDEDIPANLPARKNPPPEQKKSFGRKMKDKITGSTHEERQQERARREQKERELYQRHLAIRQAMSKALQTGKPQLIGRDKDGQDVWLEPPQYSGSSRYPGGYGYNPYRGGGLGGGLGGGMYGGGFAPPGMYARPGMAYSRPYGRGYGGGYGMPMAMGGGLLGGMMLGGALGGMGGMGGGGFC
jgi:hypothetical protein